MSSQNEDYDTHMTETPSSDKKSKTESAHDAKVCQEGSLPSADIARNSSNTNSTNTEAVNAIAGIPKDNESTPSGSFPLKCNAAQLDDLISNPLFRVITIPVAAPENPDMTKGKGNSTRKDNPMVVDDSNVTPDKVQCIEDSQSLSISQSAWKDIFNFTKGNFKPQLKRKNIKKSFNTPKRGFKLEFSESQLKRESDVEIGESSGQNTENRSENRHQKGKRKLSLDSEAKSQSSPRNSGHSRGRGRGKGKGRGKSSKPRDQN